MGILVFLFDPSVLLPAVNFCFRIPATSISLLFLAHLSRRLKGELIVYRLIRRHTCDISLFRRELPIFCPFLRKSPYENFIISLYILYISLFGNPGLPTKIQKFPSLFNHSPYLEKDISLFVFPSVSHVCPASVH